MTTYTWMLGSDGDWNTASNWTPATAPDATDADVTIDATPTLAAYGITIAAGASDTIDSLTMNAANNLAGSNSDPYDAAILVLDGTLVFAPGSAGDIDGSLQTAIQTESGSNALVVNAGTVSAFVQSEGNLDFTGTNGIYFTNYVQALAGTVTIDTSAINELSGNTLFDGIFEAKGLGSIINLGGASGGLVVNIETIEGPPLNPGGWTELTFNDPSAQINEWNGANYVSVETSLTEIAGAGTVDVLDGRDYATANTITIDAGTGTVVPGMLNLQAGTVTTAGIDINGGIVQGAATIVGDVMNDGTLIALGGTAAGTLDLTGSLTGTGLVAFDFDSQAGTVNPIGATLLVDSVSAGQTIVMNGGDTLRLNSLADFAGTIEASVFGTIAATIATVNAGTLVVSDGTRAVATLALSGTAAAQPVTVSGSVIAVGTAIPGGITAAANALNVISSGASLSTIQDGIAIAGFGNNNTITLHGASDTARLEGDRNMANLFGANGVIQAIGGGNTITAGAGDAVDVSATAGVADQINANNVQSGVPEPGGGNSGIVLAADTEAGVTGADNFITLGTNDVLGVIGGGGNTVNAGAGDFVYLSGTNGTADQISANGVQPGVTLPGNRGSGIQLAANTQVGVTGGNNVITLVTADVLGAIGGGGNTITAGAGNFIYLSGTGGTADLINANGVQAGVALAGNRGSGIQLAAGTQVGVTGGNNCVTLATNDVLGAIGGGGNTITATAGDFIYLAGTNGMADQLNANGVQAGVTLAGGRGSGIQLAAGTQVGVTGGNNYVTLATDDILGVIGGGGNTVVAGPGDFVYLAGTNGAADQVVAEGLRAGVALSGGRSSGIQLAASAQVGVTGHNNFITLAANDVLGVIGGGNTITAGAGDFVYLSGTNGTADQLNANGVRAGVALSGNHGSGIQLAANAQVSINGGNNSISLDSGAVASVTGTAETIAATSATINLGAGSTANLTGSNNTVTLAANTGIILGNAAGIGFITGSLGSQTVQASAGAQLLGGFSAAQGDQIDLRQILAGIPLAHNLSNLGAYVSDSASGSNTVLAISGPNGSDTVFLAGVGALSLQDLINSNALALPPH